jgi:Prokaryotic diacylglycerol kinase
MNEGAPQAGRAAATTSPFKSTSGLKRILNAAGYSCAGLIAAYRHEHAFRQELWIALPLLVIAGVVEVGAAMRALMIVSILAVLIVELLNSAIEACQGPRQRSGVAGDCERRGRLADRTRPMSGALDPRPNSPLRAALQRSGIDPDAPWLVKLFALFLNSESPSPGAATRAVEQLFPHIDFHRLRPVDIVRIPLQLIALLLVRFQRPPAERAGVLLSRRWVPASMFLRLMLQLMRYTWALAHRLIRPIAHRIDALLVRTNLRGDDPLGLHRFWRSWPLRCLIVTSAAILAVPVITTPLEPANQALLGLPARSSCGASSDGG